MDQVTPEGVVAPVESEKPAIASDGVATEAVKPAAEPQAAKPEAKSDDEPKGVAKRIKELTDRIRAAEERERRYLSMLERGQAPQQPAKSDDDEPVKSLKDFNYDEKSFLEYSEKRLAARADKAAKEAAQRWRAEQDAIARRAKYDERVAAFSKTVDDFDDVVNDRTPVSEGMADFLLDSDEAGALMYYLGNNPEEARKLYYMSPAKAGRELTKLEDRLVAERKKAAEKPVTNAPAPAPKIDAVEPSIAVSTTSPESDKLSTKEWVARERRRLAKKGD